MIINFILQKYLIFCQNHTPLKLRRVIDQKQKKKSDEILKFFKNIEKIYSNYNFTNKYDYSYKLPKKSQFFQNIVKSDINLKRKRDFIIKLKRSKCDIIEYIYEIDDIYISRKIEKMFSPKKNYESKKKIFLKKPSKYIKKTKNSKKMNPSSKEIQSRNPQNNSLVINPIYNEFIYNQDNALKSDNKVFCICRKKWNGLDKMIC